MKKYIFEGMDYLDLEGVIEPKLTVDSYSANMGKDCDVVTLSFVVGSQQAGKDLADWFERGYDWVLDAEVSEGELSTNRFVVFVEMARRTAVPKHIIELLSDLETLTGLKAEEWVADVDGGEYPIEEAALKQVIILSPHEYRMRYPEDEEEDEDDLLDDEDEELTPEPPPVPEPPPEQPPPPPAPPPAPAPPPPPAPAGGASPGTPGAPQAPQAPQAPAIPGVPVGAAGALAESQALNDMRAIAGLPSKKIFRDDPAVRNYRTLAGL